MLEGQDASVFYGLHDREQAHIQEALPERTVDIAQAHERAHVIVSENDLFLGLLPIRPVMDRPGRGHDSHLESVIPGPVAPVVVVPVDREQLTEQPDGYQRFPRYQPMRCHNTLDAVIPGGTKNLPELPVQTGKTVRHLERAQDAIFGVGLVRGNEGAQGSGFDPGVLVQEIDIIVALVQGVLHALVVGLGKSQVISASDKLRFRVDLLGGLSKSDGRGGFALEDDNYSGSGDSSFKNVYDRDTDWEAIWGFGGLYSYDITDWLTVSVEYDILAMRSYIDHMLLFYLLGHF